MKLYLLDDKKNVTATIALKPPLARIGREDDNDISLVAAGISRYHAELICDHDRWYVRDLGSTNGTKVNNLSILDRYLLHAGDLIEIGEQCLRFGEPLPSADTAVCRAVSTGVAAAATAEGVPRVVPQPDSGTVAATVPSVLDDPAAASSIIINLPRSEDDNSGTGRGIVLEPVTVPDASPDISSGGTAGSGIPPLTLNPEPVETVAGSMAAPGSSPGADSRATLLAEPAAIFSASGNLFGKKDSPSVSPAKRRSANLLFYTCIICLPVIFICLFIIINRNTAAKPSVRKGQQRSERLIVDYEKKIVSRDNVFRFHLLLDQGKAVFMLDDLKSRRHYLREVPGVKPALLTELLNEIKDSDFMSLSPVADGSQVNETDE
ncbi:MAG: FHA domain-containing protein, partial [Victivallales bacterium]|nr:FHA domain-containing protein [Victivallales bacterium]